MGKIQRSPASPKRPLHNLQIHIENHQKALPISKRFMKSCVKNILTFLNVDCEEISLYFTTEKKITLLHEQFFQDNTPTDCISFPIDKKHLGEIFVCPSVAINYAKKHNQDPLEEVLLYVVHGILHLVGYDDMTPQAKKVMRRMEKKCMDHLRIAAAKRSTAQACATFKD